MRFNFWLTGWEVGLEPKARWQLPGKILSHYVITLCWAPANLLYEQQGGHLITVFLGT